MPDFAGFEVAIYGQETGNFSIIKEENAMNTLITIISVALIFNASSSYAFDDIDIARIAGNSFVVADWLQTRYIADSPDYYEKNKILGKEPTTGEVNLHFTTLLIAYNLTAEFIIDPRKKTYFYYAISAGHGIHVIQNYKIGISIKF